MLALLLMCNSWQQQTGRSRRPSLSSHTKSIFDIFDRFLTEESRESLEKSGAVPLQGG